ncbi:MAG: redoxin domain-containing protein [Proteobacteria bacterium]|nr:redoxin domain-containing protein [Pseudomonadota bacterium]
MTNQTGGNAVDFVLPDTNGQEHKLSDFEGRWLLLVFHRHLG